MIPAPSGLLKVDGLNRLLGSLRLRLCSGSQCIPPPSRPSHSPSYSRNTPRPQMPTPELLLQMRKLRQQVMRRLPLQPLQQAADRHLRRDRYEQVHMVSRDVPFMIRTSCSPHISRIKSRTRGATSPTSAGRLYFVIHTTCKWISNTVCAPRRYSPPIPSAYPCDASAEAVA